MEVLRRCRVSHNNDIFCSGRSWLLSLYPLSCGWHSQGRVVLMGWVLALNSAMLLLFLYRALSGALIIHWSKLPLKLPSMKCFVNFRVWPTIISPLSRPTGLCCFISAERSQQNFHCMVFYCILLRFAAAWVKLFSPRRLNIGCKWEQIHSLMGSLVLI